MRSERSSGPSAAARAAVCAGSTCSPARQEGREIDRLHPWGRGRGRGRAVAAPRASAVALVAQQHNAGQRAGVLTLQERRVVEAQETAHRHERGRARGAEDVGRLSPLEPGVHRHQHGAGAQRAESGQHPFGAVGGPDGHAAARFDARGDEAARVGVHRLGELGVREAVVAVDQDLVGGVAQRVLRHQIRDGAPGQVGPGILVLRRGTTDTGARAGRLPHLRLARRHGCWLDTETTSPLMYDE